VTTIRSRPEHDASSALSEEAHCNQLADRHICDLRIDED
jgi:hypothetical protein